MVHTILLAFAVAVLIGAFAMVRRIQRSAAANLARATSSERAFSESFHASPIPLAMTSMLTHRIIEANNAYVKMIGWSREELIGRTGAELGMYEPEVRIKLARRLRRSGLIRDHAITL